MKNFKLNDSIEWVCCGCGSTDVIEHPVNPSVEDVYKEVPNEDGDMVEMKVSVVTESYSSLECKHCHSKEVEAV
ncbi:hypothetical protein [Aliivibrio fischeri]|uniref:hypothetical protein n=1 Tax=Aliivibrio fischeri TaxID=668 RepID=UPI00080EAAA1|nr:hypothetical protein [Aliivibrio fischeri]OCH08110.1 hypothetical protein A6E09_17325 [Aliivibrio fischeri]